MNARAVRNMARMVIPLLEGCVGGCCAKWGFCPMRGDPANRPFSADPLLDPEKGNLRPHAIQPSCFSLKPPFSCFLETQLSAMILSYSESGQPTRERNVLCYITLVVGFMMWILHNKSNTCGMATRLCSATIRNDGDAEA